ncbi:cellulose-binding protein [Streptomyces sp. PSRA5]|uniref:cellulose-binding protein n=1 Tax=Streptomyces panacea TaxID=3035064 RepID=UPI00339C41B6
MAAARASAHGFDPARGRGYRPEQVDRRVTELSGDREDAEAQERRLAVVAERLQLEAELLRQRVEALPPQTYDSLGDRAQKILALVAEEADGARTTARENAQAAYDEAGEAVRRTREAARAHAEAVTADADAYATRTVEGAQGAADERRTAARRDAEEVRGAALARFDDIRQRTEALLTELSQEHADRLAATTREFTGREAEAEAYQTGLATRSDAQLADARRAFAEGEESARHIQEDAAARAEDLIAQARAAEERTVRETERILREHTEVREEVQARMTHVRNSLAALTGRAPVEAES